MMNSLKVLTGYKVCIYVNHLYVYSIGKVTINENGSN